MTKFPLKIVTPSGLAYEGEAEKLVVRTTTGDVAILARHINYVTPLGMGQASVTIDGEKRHAACIGGMLTVMNGAVTLVPTTFEWAEDIDAARAEASHNRAKTVLDSSDASETDLKLASARLKRALIRKSVAETQKK